jgi:3-hydroxy-9,10-secoandrosta-1,3,5(10)-triene-9,17-dione monooxygenase
VAALEARPTPAAAGETRAVPSREDLVDSARALAPRLAERAETTERERTLPAETIAELRASGFPRIMQPRRFGGFGLGIDTAIDVSTELARGCASTAWTMMVFAVHGPIMAGFPLEAQEEMWAGDGDVLASGAGVGDAAAVRSEGGYRLSGRWPFSSGIDHAEWHIVGSVVLPPPPDRPIPDWYWFAVPRAGFSIVDDWHTTGLRGTGSKVAVLENAFVPAHRAVDFALLREARGPGAGLHEEAIFKVPLRAVLAPSLVGVSLGTAGAALDWWEAWQAKRTGPGFRAMRELTGTQVALGEAAARLDAALTVARHTSAEIMREAEAGVVADFERRSLHNLRVAYAARMCVELVDLLFETGGGSALYETKPLQRHWRDVHAAAAHITNRWPLQCEEYGRSRFGLPSSGPFFF